MMTSEDSKDIEFGGPATYRIVVQGTVDEGWIERLAGMEISTSAREGGAPRTTLSGSIRDQAELSGVLDSLHGLHLPILSVEKVNGGSHEPSDDPSSSGGES